MKIYHYDPVTGVVLSEGVADPDPLEPGRFLIPAFATKLAPPAPSNSHARAFRNGAWGYVAPGDLDSTPSPEVPAPTAEDVVRERQRRFALGFDYDFNDYRGIHHIGTTPADMEGWARVNVLKDALFQAGDSQTEITVMTDTGPVEVTGPEWNSLLLWAAINHEQPLWQASFALQAMPEIPADFATNPAYWP